ncbi:hypothetical protein KIPB_002290 [Kipferlia bialata]|uniref:Ferritin-like diiron domain-containing protein n=1 Tax=Kipferlia bialata TaxID=797122 RepID=A0A9K3GFV5_9EUKA|nr:hypothetical protein KIPB_002290 [Kipferlia bialata]|eukprot:g2290.t1
MSTKSVTGTETEKNLLKSFAGESQARMRYEMFAKVAKKYEMFAKVAKKEGYEQISAVFQITADQEKEHAKKFFRFLESGSECEITAAYPSGVIGNTRQNLAAAAGGENEEWTLLYPKFAQTAREEVCNSHIPSYYKCYFSILLL